MNAEDHEGKLRRHLLEAFPFDGADVVEAGAGTGRLTAFYAERARKVRVFDRSPHMLETARRNLAPFGDKIGFGQCEHLQIPDQAGPARIFIEGWAFGHKVRENEAQLDPTTDALVRKAHSLVEPGGCIVLIESLGTRVTEPTPPSAALGRLFHRLESHHGFERTVVATDYRFPSIDDAVRICGFFFGDAVGEAIREAGSLVVPEFTGVWRLSRDRRAMFVDRP